MIVYRIAQSAYKEDLSGKGAFLHGGRWNSEGVYALYTSTHRSLALLELLVHIPIDLLRKKDYFLMEIELPESKKSINIESLSNSQLKGDSILKANKVPYFSVPSILFQEEKNIVLNPSHSLCQDLNILKVDKLALDRRFQ